MLPVAVWLALGLLAMVVWLAPQMRDSAADGAKPSPCAERGASKVHRSTTSCNIGATD